MIWHLAKSIAVVHYCQLHTSSHQDSSRLNRQSETGGNQRDRLVSTCSEMHVLSCCEGVNNG